MVKEVAQRIPQKRPGQVKAHWVVYFTYPESLNLDLLMKPAVFFTILLGSLGVPLHPRRQSYRL
jgi:hypothetical protein